MINAYGSYGTYGQLGDTVLGANPAAKCAKWKEKYQKLYSKGSAPWRVRRAKKKMDAACQSASATSQAFTESYEAAAGEADAAQQSFMATTQAQLQPASKTPMLVLLGGAAVIAVLLIATGNKGEKTTEPKRRLQPA